MDLMDLRLTGFGSRSNPSISYTVVMSVMGGGEIFFQIVRSQKPPLLALYNLATTLFSYPRHLYDPTWMHSIQ